MLRPEPARENLMQQVLRIVEIHLDLFQHYLAFFGDVLGIEAWSQHQVRDDVESDRQILIENFSVEANLFFGSEGVEHAPDGIHFTSDSFRRTPLGAFEHHMLHKVRQPILLERLAARTVAHPHTDRDRANMAHRLGHYNQTVGQNVTLDVALFGNHNFWDGLLRAVSRSGADWFQEKPARPL